MIETRVWLQAALNGDRTKAAHPATPVSVEEPARHAAACVAAGATVKEPAHDIGGDCLVATVTDPDGNVLGLLQDR
jgi:predicted enzyme related to lactoylglutathione lyase